MFENKGVNNSLLAGASLLVLALFLFIFLKQSYSSEKKELLKAGSLTLKKAINTAEQESWQMAFMTLIEEGVDTLEVDEVGSDVSIRVLTLDHTPFTNSYTELIHDPNDSLMVKADLHSWTDSYESHHFEGVFQSLVKNKIDQKQFWNSIDSVLISNCSSQEDNLWLTTRYSNQPQDLDSSAMSTPLQLLSDDSYVRAEISSGRKILLSRMIPLFAGSLFLFALSVFAFYSVLNTIKKQKKLSAKQRDFVHNMTHELNTPATTIGLALEAIKNRKEITSEKRDDYLAIASNAVKKLHEMTDRVLESVKIEEGGELLNNSEIEINHFTLDLVSAFEIKTGSAILVGSKPNPLTITVDKHHLRNVLNNILDNAIKYGGENVDVQIDIAANKSMVSWEISDNGPGIPKKDEPFIFDKFYRVNTGNMHNTKGYGLGLHYAKSIIEKMGGSLTFQNNMPKGSVFKVKIPRKNND